MKKKRLILILLLILSITGCGSNKADNEDIPEKVVEEADKSLIELDELPDFYNEPNNFKQRLIRDVGVISTIDELYIGVISKHNGEIYANLLRCPDGTTRFNKRDIVFFEGNVENKLNIDGIAENKKLPLIVATSLEIIRPSEVLQYIEPDDNTEEANEPTKKEPVEEDEPVEEAKEEPQEPVTLFSGTWTVGDDIEAGSYIVTCKGRGNFTVYDKNGGLVTTEVLSEKETEHYVTKIKIDLEDGYKIKLSGMQEVYFTPN